MEYQPVTGKQALLIVALTIILWTPGMLAVIFTVNGVWHVSDRQLSLFAPVNVIVGVGLLIWIYRKWISKIEKFIYCLPDQRFAFGFCSSIFV
jgi:hypothetical protein